jgi:Predicted acyltransferases
MATAARSSAVPYQPHIDGLRAVAVLLVILHHLGNWAWLSGGFVGVDVFFVISGYLITRIVKFELDAGKFSFGRFYKRRVVRLAPAYFVVLFATTIAAIIWMLPEELLAYARSVIASSFFLANVHMWTEVGGYFGARADTVPLLHLWTLAVEEQFYIFWPVILLSTHQFFAGRARVGLILALVVAGVFASQWGVENHPSAAYYLLPTRAFELAARGLLAYLRAPGIRTQRARLAACAGMIMICYSALAFDGGSQFPGYAALVPVVGTAMVLRWGEGTPVGALLSTSIATLIGRSSYPAYLWHWPIIAFLNLNEVPLTTSVGLGVLGATLLLAWLTYRGLELPARRFRPQSAARVILAGAGFPILVSTIMATVIIRLDGMPARFPESINLKSKAIHASPAKARGLCNEAPPRAPLPPEQCVLGRPTGKVDFLLVGDSHANHFTGFMDVLGRDANLRGYDITRSNTPFLTGVDLSMPGEPVYNAAFRPRVEYLRRLIAEEHYHTIVLAGNYAAFYERGVMRAGMISGRAAFELGMRNALAEAQSAASHVVVILPVPVLNGGLHDCPVRSERFHREMECTLPATEFIASTRRLREFIETLQAEFPRVTWVDPSLLICDEEECASEIDGVPLYRDAGHLNDVGSRHLAGKWIEKFGNPLRRSDPDRGEARAGR